MCVLLFKYILPSCSMLKTGFLHHAHCSDCNRWVTDGRAMIKVYRHFVHWIVMILRCQKVQFFLYFWLNKFLNFVKTRNDQPRKSHKIVIHLCPTGAIHLNDCPRQHYIPIYLIVVGVFGLILSVLSCLPCAQEPKDGTANPLSRLCTIWNSLTSFFIFCWFIAGKFKPW